MTDVTRILQDVASGNLQAAEDLLPLVYAELRRIAASKMARENPGHTLQPTALVHEAWLRLVNDGRPEFKGRSHFFAAAGEAMRRILVESARRKKTLKRGAGAGYEELHESQIMEPGPTDEMLAINDALELLAVEDPAAANLVKLRYFLGMTMEEASTAMEMPLRSTERLWVYAKAWLRGKIDRF